MKVMEEEAVYLMCSSAEQGLQSVYVVFYSAQKGVIWRGGNFT